MKMATTLTALAANATSKASGAIGTAAPVVSIILECMCTVLRELCIVFPFNACLTLVVVATVYVLRCHSSQRCP